MSKRDEFVDVAISQIGEKETPINQIKYNDWYYDHHVSGDGYAWCDVFVSWCAMCCGILDILVPMQNYVPSTVNWYKERNQYFAGNYTPKKGDLAIFSNESHIGIVEYYDGRTHTIEGNKSDMVKRCDYNTYGSIIGYCKVDFNDEPMPTPTPVQNERIANVQRWLNDYGYNTIVDGICGSQTFTNVVKVYQNELNKQFGAGLVVDGVYGAKTYDASYHQIGIGAKGNITKSIQAMLICKNYELALDGDYGDDTAYTVKGFQFDVGLDATGIVDQDTTAELYT